MKLSGFSTLGIILSLLLGCAKISPTDTSKMTSDELCEILMGKLVVPPRDRRTVNAEVRHRGISCRDEAVQTEFNQQRDMFRRERKDY
jgi:hypothetical protein